MNARGAVTLVLPLLLAACFSEHVADPGDGPVSFAQDVQPIFTGSCALGGCHSNPANPSEKPMRLTQAEAYDAIVNVSAAELPSMDRIEPGNPDRSYLVHKIQGTHQQQGGSGDRMPIGGALSQAQIATIRRWVTEGAQRN